MIDEFHRLGVPEDRNNENYRYFRQGWDTPTNYNINIFC